MVELPNDKDETIKDNVGDGRRMSLDEITFGNNPPVGGDVTLTPAAVSRISRTSATALDTPGPAGVDTPTLERLRPKPIDVNNITVTPQRYPESQPSPSQAPRSRLVSGDDHHGTMATPNTPYGAHWTPDPSPRTKIHCKKVLDALPRQGLTEIELNQMERFRNHDPSKRSSKIDAFKNAYDKFSDVDESKSKHENNLDNLEQKGVPIIGRDKRSFDEIMEEKYQKQGKSWKNMGDNVSKKARLELDNSVHPNDEGGESRKILEVVVLMVAKKLQHQAEELHRCVEQLGGTFSWHLTNEVTHFVFLGKQNDLTRDFRSAKDQGCHVVAPDWLFMCRDERDKIPEVTFPHTYNPKMRLDLTHDSSSLSTSRLSRTAKSIPKPKLMPVTSKEKVEDTLVESEELMNEKTPPPTDTMKVTEAVSANMADFNNLLDSVNSTPVGSNKKTIKAVLTTQDKAFETPKANDDKSHEEMEVTIDGSDKKESQVQWKDPQEEVERRRLTDQLNTLETQDLSGQGAQENVQNNLDSMTLETQDLSGQGAQE